MKVLVQKIWERPLLFWIIVNLCFLFVSIFLFHPYFETNDDALMALMAEGVYGQKEYHLVYMSVFIGRILQFLYGVFPSLRWYSLIQYVILFFSFTVITYILARKGEKAEGSWVALLFLLAFFTEGYVAIQYTKTSAFAAFGAYALLFNGLKRKNWKQVGIGAFLLTASSLLRFKSFLGTLPFAAGMGIFEVCMTWTETEKMEKWRALKRYVFIFVCLLTVLFCLERVNLSFYRQTEGWSKYWEFNKKREEVLDFQRLDSVRYKEVFQREGISENDILSYSTWQFAAPDVFHLDLMEKILEVTSIPMNVLDLKKLVKDYGAEMFQFLYSLNAFVIAQVSILLIQMIYGRKKNWMPALYGCSLFALLTAYFLYKGRWTYRTTVIFFFGMFFMTLYYWYKNQDMDGKRERKKVWIVVAGILLFLNGGIWMKNTFIYKREVRENMDRIRSFNDMISRDKEHLYLIDTFTDATFYQWDVFHAYKEGDFDNVCSFGSWMTNSPVALNVLLKYGTDNPYKSAYMLPEALVVDNHYMEEKIIYIKEHYGVEVMAMELEEAFGFQIYKVVEKNRLEN